MVVIFNVNVYYIYLLVFFFFSYNSMNSCILYVNADRQLIPMIQWPLIGLLGLMKSFTSLYLAPGTPSLLSWNGEHKFNRWTVN